MSSDHDEATTTGRKPFPKDPEGFAQDDRVAYSEEDNTWTLGDEDGSEWEWIEFTKKWVPLV